MEPIIFIYSINIKGYDVTVTIEFFPYIVVLEDSSAEPMDDEFENVDTFLNLWNSQQLEVYSVLSYFTIGKFYRWAIFCRNILPLGYFLQKHFTTRLFSTETFYRWASLLLGYFLQYVF